MSLLRCVICKSEKQLYHLNRSCGDKRTVRTYIEEYLGPCENVLQEDDGICNVCVYLLNILLALRKQIYSFIAFNRGEKPFSFEPIYQNFITKLQKITYIGCDNAGLNVSRLNLNAPEKTTEWGNSKKAEHNESLGYPNKAEKQYVDETTTYRIEECRIDFLLEHHTALSEIPKEPETRLNNEHSGGSPSANGKQGEHEREFVQGSGLPVKKNEEEDIASTVEGAGTSLQREDIPIADDDSEPELLDIAYSSPFDEENEEIEAEKAKNAFYNRKRRRRRSGGRRRRRGWNWTRPKRSKSRQSIYSEPAYRRNRESAMSLYTYAHSDWSDNNDGAASTTYADSYYEISYQSKRARSVSALSEDEVVYRYKCLAVCPQEFRNLTDLTDHKVEHHKMLAKYICYECHGTKFVSREDLKLHNDAIHRILMSNCPLCSLELRTVEDLQIHIAEHKLYSHPCTYCDRSFVSENSRLKHVGEYHKGRKNKIKRLFPQTVAHCVYNSSKKVATMHDSVNDGRIVRRLSSARRLRDICIDHIADFQEGKVDVPHLMEITYDKRIHPRNNQEIPHSEGTASQEVGSEGCTEVNDVIDVETTESTTSSSSCSCSSGNETVPVIKKGPEKTFAYEHFEKFAKQTDPHIKAGVKNNVNNQSKYLENIESKRKECGSNGPVNSYSSLDET